MNHNVCACVTLSCRKSAILPACRCLRHVIKNCHLQIVLISCSKRWSMSFLTSQTFWCTWKTLCPQCVWTCLQTINFLGGKPEDNWHQSRTKSHEDKFFHFFSSTFYFVPQTLQNFCCLLLSVNRSFSLSHSHTLHLICFKNSCRSTLVIFFFLSCSCLLCFVFIFRFLFDWHFLETKDKNKEIKN